MFRDKSIEMYVKHVDLKALVEKHGKRCPICKKKKQARAFNLNAARHDGRQAYCRECVKSRYGPNKAAYDRSPKGRARKNRYNHSTKGRKTYQRYRENSSPQAKRLREDMVLIEKVYRRDRPLHGSALGA